MPLTPRQIAEYHDRILRVANVILSDQGEQYSMFVRALKDFGVTDEHLNGQCMAYQALGGAADEVVIYPNIILNRPGIGEAHLLSLFREGYWYHKNEYTALIKPSLDVFHADAQDEHRMKRWAYNIDSVVKKTETIKLARYLVRVLRLNEKGFRDDQIRDMAQRLQDANQPPALIFCDEPQDYFRMFTCQTNTCAMVQATTHRSQVLDEMAAAGRYSAEWFHYNPHTQGVFIEKNGTVVARSLLLRRKSDDMFEVYHTVNGSTGPFRNALTTLLHNRGLRIGDRISVKEKFEVPPTELRGKLYMPLPYHDSFYADYYIAWNEAKRVFECGPGHAPPADLPWVVEQSYYNWKGYVPTTLDFSHL